MDRSGASIATRDKDTGLYTQKHFERGIAGAVSDAYRVDGPYSVVACAPRSLPDEDVTALVQQAAACVRDLLRREDIAGRLEGDILAIGLAGAGSDSARVLSHRLQSELTLRSTHVRTSVWDAGYACFPEDGTTWQELLEAAIASARGRRRNLSPPGGGLRPTLATPSRA